MLIIYVKFNSSSSSIPLYIINLYVRNFFYFKLTTIFLQKPVYRYNMKNIIFNTDFIYI